MFFSVRAMTVLHVRRRSSQRWSNVEDDFSKGYPYDTYSPGFRKTCRRGPSRIEQSGRGRQYERTPAHILSRPSYLKLPCLRFESELFYFNRDFLLGVIVVADFEDDRLWPGIDVSGHVCS